MAIVGEKRDLVEIGALSVASRIKDKLPFYYGWVVVGASGSAVLARMAPSITTLTLFIFPLSEQFGWSRTLISGSVSAGALAALVLSPAIGWAIDRYGVRMVLVVSMLIKPNPPSELLIIQPDWL